MHDFLFRLQNPAQVGVALQVFHYLGQLPPTLLSVLGGFRNAIQHDIQNALDPATLVQGGDGGGNSIHMYTCGQFPALIYVGSNHLQYRSGKEWSINIATQFACK